MTPSAAGRAAAIAAALAIAAAPLACAARSAPFVPARDDAVLEELPRPRGGEARELRALRRALAARPRDLGVATRAARRYLELARAEGDPRFLGRAEGALLPWWALAEPPGEVRLLRAAIRQSRHAFAEARADLHALLRREPGHAEAWLALAVIEQARGDLVAARRSCAPLLRLRQELAAAACLAGAARGAAEAERARRALRDALAAAPDAAPALRAFALAVCAELEARRGRREAAARALEEALTVTPRAPALLARWADVLLDAGRARHVAARLADETRDDGLLLRLALAERRLGRRAAEARGAELRARFAAARLRGDRLHLGDEARFRLELEGDVARALPLAEENFAVQREPRDARILLEAALAAGAPGAAEPALRWLRETGLDDAALAPLRARLEGAR